jgi:hypothetical protein
MIIKILVKTGIQIFFLAGLPPPRERRIFFAPVAREITILAKDTHHDPGGV